MYLRTGLIIFLGLLWQCGLAQNLVKNPSFEAYNACPSALGTFQEDVTHWSTPTGGSTDYFNTCSTVMGAPENFNGIQQPKYGNAYAGLYFYAPANYREYIQVPLKRNLQKGETYVLEFFVSLAEGSDFAVKDFGVVFSNKALDLSIRTQLSRTRLLTLKGNPIHFFEVNHPKFHEDKTSWLKVREEFVAKGHERFLTLGNLRTNKNTRKVQTKRRETKKGAYYYVDMIALTNKNLNLDEKPIAVDTLVTFNHVNFNFDQFTIGHKAKAELLSLYHTLVDNVSLQLEIHGHTDNLGSDGYNQRLALKRAKSIGRYLIEQGIAADRISWFGHGSTKPLGSNKEETGRARNRRAEFLLKSDGRVLE